MRRSTGFTLIELMIVIVVIGILAAMSLPNYLRMADYTKEAAVKANMHTLQLAMEDYAVLHEGIYATAAEKAQVKALLPEGRWPVNPFTSAVLTDAEVTFGADPDAAGEIGSNPATSFDYTIKGYGKSALLSLTLDNGG